jgi:hypothetical protein
MCERYRTVLPYGEHQGKATTWLGKARVELGIAPPAETAGDMPPPAGPAAGTNAAGAATPPPDAEKTAPPAPETEKPSTTEDTPEQQPPPAADTAPGAVQEPDQ